MSHTSPGRYRDRRPRPTPPLLSRAELRSIPTASLLWLPPLLHRLRGRRRGGLLGGHGSRLLGGRGRHRGLALGHDHPPADDTGGSGVDSEFAWSVGLPLHVGLRDTPAGELCCPARLPIIVVALAFLDDEPHLELGVVGAVEMDLQLGLPLAQGVVLEIREDPHHPIAAFAAGGDLLDARERSQEVGHASAREALQVADDLFVLTLAAAFARLLQLSVAGDHLLIDPGLGGLVARLLLGVEVARALDVFVDADLLHHGLETERGHSRGPRVAADLQDADGSLLVPLRQRHHVVADGAGEVVAGRGVDEEDLLVRRRGRHDGDHEVLGRSPGPIDLRHLFLSRRTENVSAADQAHDSEERCQQGLDVGPVHGSLLVSWVDLSLSILNCLIGKISGQDSFPPRPPKLRSVAAGGRDQLPGGLGATLLLPVIAALALGGLGRTNGERPRCRGVHHRGIGIAQARVRRGTVLVEVGPTGESAAGQNRCYQRPGGQQRRGLNDLGVFELDAQGVSPLTQVVDLIFELALALLEPAQVSPSLLDPRVHLPDPLDVLIHLQATADLLRLLHLAGCLSLLTLGLDRLTAGRLDRRLLGRHQRLPVLLLACRGCPRRLERGLRDGRLGLCLPPRRRCLLSPIFLGPRLGLCLPPQRCRLSGLFLSCLPSRDLARLGCQVLCSPRLALREVRLVLRLAAQRSGVSRTDQQAGQQQSTHAGLEDQEIEGPQHHEDEEDHRHEDQGLATPRQEGRGVLELRLQHVGQRHRDGAGSDGDADDEERSRPITAGLHLTTHPPHDGLEDQEAEATHEADDEQCLVLERPIFDVILADLVQALEAQVDEDADDELDQHHQRADDVHRGDVPHRTGEPDRDSDEVLRAGQELPTDLELQEPRPSQGRHEADERQGPDDEGRGRTDVESDDLVPPRPQHLAAICGHGPPLFLGAHLSHRLPEVAVLPVSHVAQVTVELVPLRVGVAELGDVRHDLEDPAGVDRSAEPPLRGLGPAFVVLGGHEPRRDCRRRGHDDRCHDHQVQSGLSDGRPVESPRIHGILLCVG